MDDKQRYTIAILLVGAGLFYQSLARRGVALRHASLIVIGIAVVKFFVLDTGNMNGIVWVTFLLALTLSLVSLPWLNR